MKSKRERLEATGDRAHELCVFLGGDDVALRISRALRRWNDVTSVADLKAQYAEGLKSHGGMNWPGHPLMDIRLIGDKAMERIREKIEGPAAPLMDEQTAWLVIRMQIALLEEGIGPWGDETNDKHVIERAYRMVRHRVPETHLEDFE